MEDRLPRKLAAILYADVAGYSRLTGEDEDTTHRRLSQYLDQIAVTIERYGGRVMHYAGDAVLAMFEAVVDALACAAQLQLDLKARNEDLSDERKVQFRIGVNMGDVIEDRGDIYGDGVNVAARLESLAEPGGICISESVHTAVGSKLPFDYEFMGEQAVKNIAKPVQAYHARMKPDVVLPEPSVRPKPRRPKHRFMVATAAAVVLVIGAGVIAWWQPWQPKEDPASLGRMAFPLPDKPSIAVLPFNNMSNDPEQEYFSDGLAEDLITDLSQISGLIVIARNSTFAYKGQSANIQQIGQELGARYILEGSVRKAVNRVRINAQLIDAATGAHLWAQRYDRDLTDVFALQDEITRTIVTALAVNLTKNEQAQLGASHTVSPDAYDALLRGNERLQRYTPDDMLEARALYKQAIALDPSYARAHANLAYTYAVSVLLGWVQDDAEWIRAGLQAAERSLALDSGIPQIHFTLANLYSAQGRPESAVDSARRSIELDPNYADGYGMLAVALTFAGDLEEALNAIHTGMRLHPRHSYMYLWVKGRILFHLERFEEAAITLEESVQRNPTFDQGRMFLAATYAQMDRLEDAEWQVEELLGLRPDFTIANEERQVKYKRPEDEARLIKALRKAGLPG